MTLGDFVKYLITILNKDNIPMPYEDEKKWHELFFLLKTQNISIEKPDFIKHLWFDWDGPFPKSQELSDFLHALHWNACVSSPNPSYEKVCISPEISAFWLDQYEGLNPHDKNLLVQVASMAKEKFSPQET
jgi:hypothetical protein